MKKRCGILLMVALWTSSPLVPAGTRQALVIGNGNYTDAPLANPANDAKAVANKLEALGFDVQLRINSDRKAMREAVREFGDKLGGDSIGLFYYAGHGMQVDGENFMIPIGSDIAREDEVPDESISVNAVLRKMEGAQNAVNIVILDACRNNPFKRSFRSGSRGMNRVDGPVGSMVIFATAPGDVADDGSGQNSVFTNHLLQHIAEPGITIHQMMNRVRNGVRRDSGGRQIPWESSALTGDFFFVPGGKTPVPDQAEQLFWQIVQQENNESFYQKYLQHYPEGEHAAEARAQLQRRLGADQGRELVAKADHLYFKKNDRPGAFRLYQQAAERGSFSAMASLAKLWGSGAGTGIGRDMSKAKVWRDRSFETIRRLAESDHAFFQYQLGTLFDNVDIDLVSAVYWYRKAAEQGNAAAQNNLGMAYLSGNGVQNDDAEAVIWFRRSAEQGTAAAQHNLGSMYKDGRGVQQSDTKAVAWYRKAAEQGHAMAQNSLALMYYFGRGVKQSDKEFFVWTESAAELGDATAQYNLGLMYQDGLGVPQNDAEAVVWYRKAAKQGYEDAKQRLKELGLAW